MYKHWNLLLGQGALMELSAVDPWGTPAAAATISSAGPSPPPMVSASGASGPWGTAPTDPWGVASPTSPTSTDPWGGGAPPPSIAPPPDPWGETANRVNNVDPWGNAGKETSTIHRRAWGPRACSPPSVFNHLPVTSWSPLSSFMHGHVCVLSSLLRTGRG